MFSLTREPIDLATAMAFHKNSQSGAFVSFEGWVRNHNQGKQVAALEYEIYRELAQKQGALILAEAQKKFNLHSLNCIHRFGLLKIGERAVWVGATASHRDDAFQATRYVIDEVKHRLPIWKKEHYVNEQPQWVSCLEKHHHVHFTESEYYEKQSKILNQASLKKSRVLVVGAGGLGCPALQALAMAGVGEISVADFDKIEISNLHRQPLYAASLVGEKKALVAPGKLMELNPFVKVTGIDKRVDSQNVESLVKDVDLVLDCTDNMETKYLLHDACLSLQVPLISASIFKYEGQIRTYVPGSDDGCLRCRLKASPDDATIGNCNDFGVLGSAAMVLGAIQANEAISYLQRKLNATMAETLLLNVLDLSIIKIRNKKNEKCLFCEAPQFLAAAKSSFADFEIKADQIASDFELVDIRNQDDDYLDRFKDSPKTVVIYCHRGFRSRRLVKEYRARGYSQFYSLIGGACSL